MKPVAFSPHRQLREEIIEISYFHLNVTPTSLYDTASPSVSSMSAALLPVRVTSITAEGGIERNTLKPVIFYHLFSQVSQTLLALLSYQSLIQGNKPPVAKRTLISTYKMPRSISLSIFLADKLGVVELVVWDKDMLSKEYLREVALPLDDWFVDKPTKSVYPDLSVPSTYLRFAADHPLPCLRASGYSFYW